LAPQPPDSHQYIVSDCGGSRHFRAADFTAAETSHGAIGKAQPRVFRRRLRGKILKFRTISLPGAHAPEGRAQQIINLNN
jgi:hypothetical protein